MGFWKAEMRKTRPTNSNGPLVLSFFEEVNKFFNLCRTGTPQQMEEAIKSGVDVNAWHDEDTPLLQVMFHNPNSDVAIALIKAGANVNVKNNNGWTPLILAALRTNNPEMITVLLKAGADPKARCNFVGSRAIDFARGNPHLKDTDALKKLEKASRLSKREEKEEGLLDLCREGTVQEVENAVKNGANIHAKTDFGQTPLMLAMLQNPYQEVITALIKAGADVNAKDNEESTPLMLAAARCLNSEVITALIKAGADVNAKDNNGRTPLMRTVLSFTKPEVITALIKAGADVNARDNYEQTPLMLAAWKNGKPEVIATLIEAGADINVKNSLEQTPLMLAAMENSNPEVITALVNAGADIKAGDNNGSLAIHYAMGNPHLKDTDAIKKLEEGLR